MKPMKMKKIAVLYFSPTGTTRKIAEAAASAFIENETAERETASPDSCGVSADSIRTIDITMDRDQPLPAFETDELLILGLPVYGGRIPELVDSTLRKLKGSSTPCLPLVVYGNRAYEDALLELTELLSEQGFAAAGAGAFIGEHSYGSDIAGGRPDQSDLEKAAAFGAKVREKLQTADRADAMPAVTIPGNHPYKERSASDVVWAPETLDSCTACGLCAKRCPVGIIDAENPAAVTNPVACLHCCACVKACPIGAKVINAAPYAMFRAFLTANCTAVQKQPETFL